MLNLGAIYEEGYAGEKNFQKAFEYYTKAAKETKDPRAYLNIGSMYERGKFVNQSDEEAIKYYRMAAEQGDYIAKDILKAKGVPLHSDSIEKSIFSTKSNRAPFQYTSEDKKPLLSSIFVSNYIKNK